MPADVLSDAGAKGTPPAGQEEIVAETDARENVQPKPAESDAPAGAGTDGVELSDDQLDKVSGGVSEFSSVSNVLKTRHDTAKNSISNVR